MNRYRAATIPDCLFSGAIGLPWLADRYNTRVQSPIRLGLRLASGACLSLLVNIHVEGFQVLFYASQGVRHMFLVAAGDQRSDDFADDEDQAHGVKISSS